MIIYSDNSTYQIERLVKNREVLTSLQYSLLWAYYQDCRLWGLPLYCYWKYFLRSKLKRSL